LIARAHMLDLSIQYLDNSLIATLFSE